MGLYLYDEFMKLNGCNIPIAAGCFKAKNLTFAKRRVSRNRRSIVSHLFINDVESRTLYHKDVDRWVDVGTYGDDMFSIEVITQYLLNDV